jgi:hypothetical protein
MPSDFLNGSLVTHMNRLRGTRKRHESGNMPDFFLISNEPGQVKLKRPVVLVC